MVENLECCQFLIWGFSVEGTRFEFHQCIANQILGLRLLITEGNFMLEYIQLSSWKSDTCIFPLRFNNSLNSNHTHVFESVLLTPYITTNIYVFCPVPASNLVAVEKFLLVVASASSKTSMHFS